ncbi:MAG: helix-turn-helix domain-containing protein [Pseudonocardiaceae bacterium]
MDTPIDPALFDRDDLRPVLASHDIGALYRALNDAGISQREIARRTGQTQSEVSEIAQGTRRVDNYRVLERIAEGLGIPRERMGLSYGQDDTYPEEVTVAEPEEAEAMFRRHLLAQGGIALTGAAVTKLGEFLAELPWPVPMPLPTRLSGVHVTQVRDLTRGLERAAATYGSTPEVSTAAAAWAMRLLGVPGDEPVRM